MQSIDNVENVIINVIDGTNDGDLTITREIIGEHAYLVFTPKHNVNINNEITFKATAEHHEDNTVYEWYDADDKCDLGPLFQFLWTHLSQLQFFLLTSFLPFLFYLLSGLNYAIICPSTASTSSHFEML